MFEERGLTDGSRGKERVDQQPFPVILDGIDRFSHRFGFAWYKPSPKPLAKP